MEPVNRPYRCKLCGRIFVYAGEPSDQPPCPGYVGNKVLDCHGLVIETYGAYECAGFGEYAGLDGTEIKRDYAGCVSVLLNEDHRWAECGEYNMHAVPMRGTPAWDKYMAEGRIVMKDGIEQLHSRNKKEYVKTLRDLGYINGNGEGEINRSRQRGDHCRED